MHRTAIQYFSKRLTAALVRLIQVYQYCISPLLGARCRFYPGCSTYAREAIEKHGVIQGIWLTFKRLMKCQPFHPGGYDPIPDKNER